jgi:uncharacterized membrane protein YdjX (TVP38/TMEM64 family)
MNAGTTNGVSAASRRSWGRILLLPALAGFGLAAIFLFHLDRDLSFAALAANRLVLLGAVARHPFVVSALFAALYVVATTMSLPGSSLLTMSAGLLFGLGFGTALVVAAATLGATLLYLIARTSFGEFLRGRTSGTLERLQGGFQQDAFSYLLFLRLVPLFPFWLVNLVCALLEVPLRTFVSATLVGIIPGTAVYASVGSGLGAIFARGQKPDLGLIFTPEVLLPVIALAVLSLAPVAYRHLRQRRS